MTWANVRCGVPDCTAGRSAAQGEYASCICNSKFDIQHSTLQGAILSFSAHHIMTNDVWQLAHEWKIFVGVITMPTSNGSCLSKQTSAACSKGVRNCRTPNAGCETSFMKTGSNCNAGWQPCISGLTLARSQAFQDGLGSQSVLATLHDQLKASINALL